MLDNVADSTKFAAARSQKHSKMLIAPFVPIIFVYLCIVSSISNWPVLKKNHFQAVEVHKLGATFKWPLIVKGLSLEMKMSLTQRNK